MPGIVRVPGVPTNCTSLQRNINSAILAACPRRHKTECPCDGSLLAWQILHRFDPWQFYTSSVPQTFTELSTLDLIIRRTRQP